MTSSHMRPIGDRLDRSLPVSLPTRPNLILGIICAGTVGAVVSALTAMVMARREGRGALQPLNATSHWLHGRPAGKVREFTAAESGTGLATHYLSALFWAVPYSLWLDREVSRGTAEIMGGAAATAVLAASVDYLAMPRRLTPGWELALSPRGVGVTFVGLALGLAGGALLARALR